MFNPLPDFLEDEERIIYDIELAEEPIPGESQFYRKLKHRLGEVIIYFNMLERTIDECIIEMMNSRGEDPCIWALIQDFSFEKKMKSLTHIYIEKIKFKFSSEDTVNVRLNNIMKEIDRLRIARNLYIHAHWLNSNNLEHFESRVKHIKKHNGFYRIKKKITLSEIEENINALVTINDELFEFHEEVFSNY